MTDPDQDNPEEVYKQAKMAALDLLSRREHSALEIKKKLSRRRHFSELEFDRLCEELQEAGWLNQTRFAESFIRARRNKGQGPVRISHDLRSKGINDAESAGILEQYDDWNELAFDVLQKKASLWSNDLKLQAKWQRFLMQRGFGFDSVRYALNKLKTQSLNS